MCLLMKSESRISNNARIPDWLDQLNPLKSEMCMLANQSRGIFLHSSFFLRIQNTYKRRKSDLKGWLSPPEEGALGRGSRCVHQAPYPAVTSQTQGNCHLGRPVCLKSAKQSCKYSAKYCYLKEHAYVTFQLELITG